MSWVNFKEEEFSCKHCGKNGISHELINKLQSLRTELDFPFVITSGYRCSTHNSAVSKTGANGPHTTGKAIDIAVRDSQHRKQLIDYFSPNVTGLGIAKSFIHIDLLYEEDGFEMRPNSWVY